MKRDLAPMSVQAGVRPAAKMLYTRADIDGLPHLDSLPGHAPFLRGPYASMYPGRPWTIRQYAGFGSAADANALFRESLAGGAQGLSVAFDLPTHRGYDSDHPLALADVGLAGVAIDSVEDMRHLFAGIDLGRTSVSMTMSGAVLPIMACFIVAAEESGVAPSRLSGTIQNDILKEFMVRNTYIHEPEPSLRIAVDVAAHLARVAPRFNAMSVSGYHLQEAGANGALELALTMSNASTYLASCRARGMDAERLCEQMSFFFGVGRDFLAEIAKLRAARLLWSEVAAQYGTTGDRARALRMHCQTSGWTLSAHDPLNNVVRTTLQALAAVFGGTQSLHTNSHDEALALPGADAARLARNTQHILQLETGLCESVDPLAGSYMVERMTHDLAEHARDLMRQIDAAGGTVAAIESGWVAGEIDRAAARTQAGIDNGTFVVVGQNRFAQADPSSVPARRIDGASARDRQIRGLRRVRTRRDDAAVERALDNLRRCSRGTDGNLLACAVEAMRARATVGECTAALEQVWPRHHAMACWQKEEYDGARLGDVRWNAAKAAVTARTARLGRAPRILIAKLGQDGHDRGAKVVSAALDDAGFDVLSSGLFRQPGDVALQACESGVDLIGISSLTGAHLELVRELAACLRERGRPGLPIVVGGVIPPEDAPVLRACGVAQVFAPATSMEEIVGALLAVI